MLDLIWTESIRCLEVSTLNTLAVGYPMKQDLIQSVVCYDLAHTPQGLGTHICRVVGLAGDIECIVPLFVEGQMVDGFLI